MSNKDYLKWTQDSLGNQYIFRIGLYQHRKVGKHNQLVDNFTLQQRRQINPTTYYAYVFSMYFLLHLKILFTSSLIKLDTLSVMYFHTKDIETFNTHFYFLNFPQYLKSYNMRIYHTT